MRTNKFVSVNIGNTEFIKNRILELYGLVYLVVQRIIRNSDIDPSISGDLQKLWRVVQKT